MGIYVRENLVDRCSNRFKSHKTYSSLEDTGVHEARSTGDLWSLLPPRTTPWPLLGTQHWPISCWGQITSDPGNSNQRSILSWVRPRSTEDTLMSGLTPAAPGLWCITCLLEICEQHFPESPNFRSLSWWSSFTYNATKFKLEGFGISVPTSVAVCCK